MKPRILEIRKGVLEKNDQLAHGLRANFNQRNVMVLNIVSSPGSGKTAFLEASMRSLIERGFRVAALVGDVETENDADRLKRSGAAVRQIVTHGNCHLEADMIENHLGDWDMNDYDFLFIENVGNLVCPSHYDLGEHLRVVMLAVHEGEDKPLKYPPMFNSSDLAIITKVDIAEAVEFDREAAHQNILNVRPAMPIFETSSKTGQGMDAWLDHLVQKRAEVFAAEEPSKG